MKQLGAVLAIPLGYWLWLGGSGFNLAQLRKLALISVYAWLILIVVFVNYVVDSCAMGRLGVYSLAVGRNG